jgi:ribonuclease E
LNDADNGTSDAIAPEPEADKKPAAKKPAARKSTAKKPAPKVETADAVTAPAEAEAEPVAAVNGTLSEADTKTTSGPARKGWWQRTFG